MESPAGGGAGLRGEVAMGVLEEEKRELDDMIAIVDIVDGSDGDGCQIPKSILVSL
jgi:hypothetical protein